MTQSEVEIMTKIQALSIEKENLLKELQQICQHPEIVRWVNEYDTEFDEEDEHLLCLTCGRTATVYLGPLSCAGKNPEKRFHAESTKPRNVNEKRFYKLKNEVFKKLRIF